MSDRRHVAAVDLGSHTFAVVIARADGARAGFRAIDVLKERVALTQGLEDDGSVATGTVDRALAVLRRFGQRLEGFAPEDVRVVGTSALRVATRGDYFRQAAERALGFEVDVIAGDTEATLAYLGVAHGGVPLRRRLVIDIGGGSTELAVGDGLDPDACWSEPMGHLERTKELGQVGYDRDRFAALHEQTVQTLRERRERLGDPFVEAVGTGGTIRAVAKVLGARGARDDRIARKHLTKLREELAKRGRDDEELSYENLSPRRAPTFPGGVLLLSALFEAFEMDELVVSPRGLREGILHRLLDHATSDDLRERTITRLERRYGLDVDQGRRVAQTAATLAEDAWPLSDETRTLLGYAARVHELGQALQHRRYHKEGARILRRSALPGFAMDTTMALAALVRLHHPGKKLKGKHLRRVADTKLRAQIERAVLVLRLAVLLRRTRDDAPLPSKVEVDDKRLTLTLPAVWIDDHPLTVLDLEHEAARWGHRGFELRVRYRD